VSAHPDPRRAALEQRIAQARASLAALDARNREAARRLETRRAILIGAVITSALRRGDEVWIGDRFCNSSEDLPSLLSPHLSRAHDRSAFGLSPNPEQT
jgi:hypothetical protein